MRLAFMGTPAFAAATLARLRSDGHTIAAVYTRAPAKAGRGMALTPSPVHALADGLGITVLTPTSLRGSEAAQTMRAHDADVCVVVAYGLILPQAILDAPRHGCLNLHASLLPRWRGAAPIQRAVMAGDAVSGVAVMRMEAGLDTGPVAMEERVAIVPGMTAGALHDVLMPLGADLMARALAVLARDGLSPRAQDEDGIVYAHKITNAETRIAWNRPAAQVADHVNGLSPVPGAFFEADFGKGAGQGAGKGPERVKVLQALVCAGEAAPGTLLDEHGTVACAAGAVRLVALRRAGKGGAVSGAEFVRGARLTAGTRLA